MTTANGLHDYSDAEPGSERHVRNKRALGVMTLSGNLVLTKLYRNRLKIDPAGARDVTLPAEASSDGLWFEIINAANAAETITVKDDGGATIIAILQNRKASVYCDGVAWYHTGLTTIALS